MSPKLTIIIPCYNAESFIEGTIRSALAQIYENTEIIVVDNESNDKSLDIITKVQAEHPEIIVDTAKNIYKYSWQEPVEKALSLMTGDYFMMLGADDLILPTYAKECIEFMLREKCEMMQSTIYCFSSQNKNGIKPHSAMSYNYSSMYEYKSRLLQNCCVVTPSVVYKKSVITDYTFEMRSDLYLGASDYHLYCQLADQGAFIAPSNKFLGYLYRTHQGQSTQGMVSNMERMFEIDRAIKSEFIGKWK